MSDTPSDYHEFKGLRHGWHEFESYAGMRAGEVMAQGELEFFKYIRFVIRGGEGKVDYLYRDSLSHLTTGYGFLICRCDPETGLPAPGKRGTTATAWKAAELEMTGPIPGYKWKPSETAPDDQPMTNQQVIQQLHEFIAKSVKKPWKHFAAGSYKDVVPMRLIRPDEYWLRMWKKVKNGGKSRWETVTAAMPNWQELPFFIVAAGCRNVWNGWKVGTALAGPKAKQKHYRDFEKEAVYWFAHAAKGGQPRDMQDYLRDVCRAGTKYFCKTDCHGSCELVSECKYWQIDVGKPPAKAAQPVTPVTRSQPREATPPNHYKFDQYRVELRIWDPFVRSVAYEHEPFKQFSLMGDAHEKWGELANTTHRVMVTARFKYWYEEKDGKLIGHYIGPQDMDPKPNSEGRCAEAQKRPVFGENQRYQLVGEATDWEVDTDVKFPANNPAATHVAWGQRQQNSESFSISVNFANPAYPTTAPHLRATLRGWFENNLLKLSLQSSRWPSIGVRVERARNGGSEIEDMLPGYQTPLVNAHADFAEFLKARNAKMPEARPADPKKPGPPQMNSQAFMDQQGAATFDWVHSIDWTKGPPAAQQQAAPTPAPKAASAPVTANEDFSDVPGAKEKVQGYLHGKPISLIITHMDNAMIEVHTARQYMKLKAAAAKQNVHFQINFAFRTMKQQTDLWNAYVARGKRGAPVAPPGGSNHQCGHAFDFVTAGGTNATYKWLVAHAREFEFRRAVTVEPWHWEWWESWSGHKWLKFTGPRSGSYVIDP